MNTDIDTEYELDSLLSKHKSTYVIAGSILGLLHGFHYSKSEIEAIGNILIQFNRDGLPQA